MLEEFLAPTMDFPFHIFIKEGGDNRVQRGTTKSCTCRGRILVVPLAYRINHIKEFDSDLHTKEMNVE